MDVFTTSNTLWHILMMTTLCAVKDKNFIEWSQLTPVNHEECMECPALGICGGGCPINAMHLKPGNTIHSIDERFCVHSKKTLEFFY